MANEMGVTWMQNCLNDSSNMLLLFNQWCDELEGQCREHGDEMDAALTAWTS